MTDTIIAQATPVGPGAIGIIRLSGPRSRELLEKLFQAKNKLSAFKSHQLVFGRIVDPQTKKIVDEVMAVWMQAPHSYTGEDVVEIHGHGNPHLLHRIMGLALAAGARFAEPGEFTKRAYLNGCMDLAQAEAVCDLISAESEWAASNALSQLDGALSRMIAKMRSGLLNLAATIEAGFDFVEEDVQLFEREFGLRVLREVRQQIAGLLDSFKTGRLLKDGVRVALVGRPNVGKSSLLNAILKEDRAITHHEPGTTRDVMVGEKIIAGLNFHFFDTAGIHEASHPVEIEGIQRSKALIAKADIVCLVFDASVELQTEDRYLLSAYSHCEPLLIYNKCDLSTKIVSEGSKIIRTSAKTYLGLEELETQLTDRIFESKKSDHNYVLNNVHFKHCLEKANEKLDLIIEQLSANQIKEELLAEDVRELCHLLDGITGGIDAELVLDEVFARFCIGK